MFSWPLPAVTFLHQMYWQIPEPLVHERIEQTCSKDLPIRNLCKGFWKPPAKKKHNTLQDKPNHPTNKDFIRHSMSNLSTVPFLNHVPSFVLLSTISFIESTASADCSSDTFKWARNGFKNPEAIFSVFPPPDTNNSHLQYVILFQNKGKFTDDKKRSRQQFSPRASWRELE